MKNNDEIFITDNFKKISKIYNIYKVNNIYSLEELSFENINLINKLKIKNISNLKKLENYSFSFLDFYNNLIANLGIKNNNLKWWSSETASKNPFTSNLASLIQKMYNINNIVKNNPNEKFIIYSKDKILNLNIIKLYSLKRKNIFLKKTLFLYRIKYINNLFKIFKQFISILIRKTICVFIIKNNINNKNQFKTIIKSHFFQKQINKKKYSDQFFHEFFNYIYNYNNNKIIILVHCHGNFYKIIKKIRKIRLNENIIILPYEYFLTYNSILKNFFKIFLFKLKSDDIFYNNINISSLINDEFYRSGISINSYSFYESTKNLFKNFSKINKVFMTYENRSWENMFIGSIRNISQNIKIIGFQHSVVYQASAGYYLKKNEEKIKPLPDILFTNGNITRNFINRLSDYPPNLLRVGCALRYKYLNNLNFIKFKKIKKILVPLEGVYNAISFVNKIYLLAKNHKDISFIIREHPVLKWSEFEKKLNFNIENINNLSLSKNENLIDDIYNSNLCIYWSSAACIEAIKMGMPVIHYKMNTTFSFDPLFDCKYLKWEIEDENSFKEIIRIINNITMDDYKQLLKNSNKYINDYFIDANHDNIKKLNI